MTKQIVIEIPDATYHENIRTVGEIIGAAHFLEAVIQIEEV